MGRAYYMQYITSKVLGMNKLRVVAKQLRDLEKLTELEENLFSEKLPHISDFF